MWKTEEGCFKYDGIMFDYRVSVCEGDRGNNYDIPPRATQVEVDFIGFLPDTNLAEVLVDSVEEALVESILKDRWI